MRLHRFDVMRQVHIGSIDARFPTPDDVVLDVSELTPILEAGVHPEALEGMDVVWYDNEPHPLAFGWIGGQHQLAIHYEGRCLGCGDKGALVRIVGEKPDWTVAYVATTGRRVDLTVVPYACGLEDDEDMEEYQNMIDDVRSPYTVLDGDGNPVDPADVVVFDIRGDEPARGAVMAYLALHMSDRNKRPTLDLADLYQRVTERMAGGYPNYAVVYQNMIFMVVRHRDYPSPSGVVPYAYVATCDLGDIKLEAITHRRELVMTAVAAIADAFIERMASLDRASGDSGPIIH